MLQVVCAIIAERGKVLIVQHGELSHHPGKWEFPGGKVKPGEDTMDALCREIKEELNLEIEIKEPLTSVIFNNDAQNIQLIPFLCIGKSGEIKLNEHTEFQWIGLEDFSKFDLLPADRLIVCDAENYGKIRRFLLELYPVTGNKG